MADTPKFEDTLPLEEVPKFEDTVSLDAEADDPSELESFGKGIQQGATVGFADEIGAFSGAIGSKFGGDKRPFSERYYDALEQIRQDYKRAEELNPKASFAGNLLGGGLTAAVPLGAASKVATGLGPKLAALAKTGGKVGAVTGLGTSEAKLLDPSLQDIGQAALDTSIGAGLGAGLGAGVGGLAEGVIIPAVKSAAKMAQPIIEPTLNKVGSLAQPITQATKSVAKRIPFVDPEYKSDIIRGIEMGQRGLRIGDDVSQELAEQTAKQTSKDVAKEVANIQKLAGAERTNVAKKAQTELQQGFDDATKAHMLAQQKLAEQNARELAEVVKASRQTLKEATEAVKGGGKKLSAFVEANRIKAGESLESSYNKLDDIGFKYNPVNDIAELSNQVLNATRDNPTLQNQATSMLNALSSLNKQLDATGVKGLRKTIQDFAYSADPYLGKLAKQALIKLNSNVSNAAELAGQSEVAQTIQAANKAYSTVFQLEDIVGRSKPEKAISTVQKLSQDMGKAGLSERNERLLSLMNKLDPEAGQALGQELQQLSGQLGNASKQTQEKAINQLVEQRMQQYTQANPQINIPKPKAPTRKDLTIKSQQLIEQDPSLKSRLQLEKDLTAETGLQREVPSLGEDELATAPELAARLKGASIKNAPVTELEAQDRLTRLMKKASPERGEQLLQKSKEAQKDLRLMQQTTGTEALGGITQQVLGRVGNIGIKAANALGYVGGKGETLGTKLGKASTESLNEVAKLLATDNRPEYQYFSKMLANAANQEGMGRNAGLYLLSQNPQFRQILTPNVEESAKNEIPKPEDQQQKPTFLNTEEIE